MIKLYKKSNGFTVVEVLLVLLTLAIIGVAGYVVAKHVDKKTDTTSSSTKEQSFSTASCAYIPKQNYAQDDAVYNEWRQNAKLVNFDVYLPCIFPSDFTINQLGIGSGNSTEVVSVFLNFTADSSRQNKNVVQASFFTVRALPPQWNPPNSCLNSTVGTNVIADSNPIIFITPCVKYAESKFGPVYKSPGNGGDLVFSINNSLVIWTSPPYDELTNSTSVLNIINSMTKVDPSTLEFFND